MTAEQRAAQCRRHEPRFEREHTTFSSEGKPARRTFYWCPHCGWKGVFSS